VKDKAKDRELDILKDIADIKKMITTSYNMLDALMKNVISCQAQVDIVNGNLRKVNSELEKINMRLNNIEFELERLKEKKKRKWLPIFGW